MNSDQRLDQARWILERNLHWISAAEVKVGIVIAVDTAMLGALAAIFGLTKVSENSAWSNLFSVVGALTLIAAVFCAAMAVKPQTEGPETSFVFFGRIAKQSITDYSDSFQRAGEETFLRDLLDQIHRNAQIAVDKFGWVKSAIGWSLFSLPVWATAIVLLLKDR